MFQMYDWIVNSIKYHLNCPSDEDLQDKFLLIAWLYLVMVAIQSYFFPAPYGKFTSKTGLELLDKMTEIQVPSSLGWMIQEIPSFIISIAALVHLYENQMFTKILLLAPFVVHYSNRSIFFPLKIKSGSTFVDMFRFNTYFFQARVPRC